MGLGEYLGMGAAITKGLWHLNGSSADSSGNGNNGTDSNISYVAGKFGLCASFNGTSSIINLGNSASLELQTLTLVRWVKYTAGWYSVVYTTTNVSNYGYVWALGNFNSGAVKFRGYNGAWWEIVANSDLSADWTNVIVVKTTSSGTCKIYFNGLDVTASISGIGTIDYTYKSALLLGADRASGGSYWTGLQDETFIDARAWSAEEIKKYYTFAKGRFGIL